MSRASYPTFPRRNRNNINGDTSPHPKEELRTRRDFAETPKPITISHQLQQDPLNTRLADWIERSIVSHESKGYVWKLFVHIQNQNVELKKINADLVKLRAERVSDRAELLKWEQKLHRRKEESFQLSIQYQQFVETQSCDIENLKRHVIQLSQNLEIEREKTCKLRLELEKNQQGITVEGNREQMLEQQVNQLKHLLAQQNQKRVFRSLQILNEHNEVKQKYEQAQLTINHLLATDGARTSREALS